MKKLTLLMVGHLFLALGFIGAFIPVLPTTPFLLLAAYFYSKADSKLLTWMKEHKLFGPPLTDWQESGVIGIKAKWLATMMLTIVLCWRIPTLAIPLEVKIFAAVMLIGVLVFIWSRPSRRK